MKNIVICLSLILFNLFSKANLMDGDKISIKKHPIQTILIVAESTALDSLNNKGFSKQYEVNINWVKDSLGSQIIDGVLVMKNYSSTFIKKDLSISSIKLEKSDSLFKEQYQLNYLSSKNNHITSDTAKKVSFSKYKDLSKLKSSFNSFSSIDFTILLGNKACFLLDSSLAYNATEIKKPFNDHYCI